MILHAVTIYEAAVFALRPGGVSADKQELQRAIAYRFAARDGLPQRVRVAACRSAGNHRTEPGREAGTGGGWTLHEAVRECRPGFIHLHDDQTS
ncbi:hypothetical protein ABZV80_37285 [Streptomyces sp. NPDC005132]|uniref:hypothetical protein n=1 Tax=Streptomyces sp. NPDC005132 TaxID=3154294 RepID=UPI0033A990C2